MDRLGPLDHVHKEPLTRRPINAMDRDPVRTPLDTGVRAINAMLTVGRGQRLGQPVAVLIGHRHAAGRQAGHGRSEEHTSELQSL